MTKAIARYILQKDYLFCKFQYVDFFPVSIFLSTLQVNFWFHESCISKGSEVPVQLYQRVSTTSAAEHKTSLLLWVWPD